MALARCSALRGFASQPYFGVRSLRRGGQRTLFDAKEFARLTEDAADHGGEILPNQYLFAVWATTAPEIGQIPLERIEPLGRAHQVGGAALVRAPKVVAEFRI